MANSVLYDDDFDFGGDDGDEIVKTGDKITSMELEDDDEDVDLYPSKKMYVSTAVGNDHATTTILNLRASLEERDSTIENLKKELSTVDEKLERWHATFQHESVSLLIANPEADAVLVAFQKLQESEVQIKEQLLTTKRRASSILVRLAVKEKEIAELKTVVHDLRLMLKPSMTQVRRLLLDPAIHAEFTRMKKELEAAEKKVRELQDDLAAVQFTPHSKNGKMLMAKCRTLQEENEEIGREASEGKMHELGAKLAMQKSLTQELRHGYQELQEYVDDLNYEAESLQHTIYFMQRLLEQKDHQIQQKDLQLAEYQKQAGAQDGTMKNREEEKGQQVEAKKDGYEREDDSRDRLTGKSTRK